MSNDRRDIFMTFETGETYPVAFFLFDCSRSKGNHINHARSSIQNVITSLDPTFSDDIEILSGDLTGGIAVTISRMISNSSFEINLDKLDTKLSQELTDGKLSDDIYLIGILFRLADKVDLVNSDMLKAKIEGYAGLFTIPITAGSTDVRDLAQALSLTTTRIGDRV